MREGTQRFKGIGAVEHTGIGRWNPVLQAGGRGRGALPLRETRAGACRYYLFQSRKLNQPPNPSVAGVITLIYMSTHEPELESHDPHVHMYIYLYGDI